MKKIILFSLSICLLIGCDKKSVVSEEINEVTNCLLSKDYKYEELLTKADILKHVNIDEASYKMDVSTIRGEYGSVVYDWNSNRPDLQRELLGQIINYADKNRITVKRLTFYSDSELSLYKHDSFLSLFDFTYKKLSQQEYNDLLSNLQKEYANDQTGYLKAKEFLDLRMTFNYESINNLGDRAYYQWNEESGIILIVLVGSSHFTVESKTSGDKNIALNHAVLFAKEVLEKCGG